MCIIFQFLLKNLLGICYFPFCQSKFRFFSEQFSILIFTRQAAYRSFRMAVYIDVQSRMSFLSSSFMKKNSIRSVGQEIPRLLCKQVILCRVQKHHHLILARASRIRSTLSYLISFKSVLIVCSHLLHPRSPKTYFPLQAFHLNFVSCLLNAPYTLKSLI